MIKIDGARLYDVDDNIPWSMTFCSDKRIVLDVLLPDDERLTVESIYSPEEIIKLMICLRRHMQDNYPDFDIGNM